MSPCLVILILATSFVDAAVERDGIRIEAEVEAQLFRWQITNVSAAPIREVRFYSYQCYNHQIPQGWEFTYEDHWFRAWAPEVRRAIRPGETATFGARGSSGGAVLGTAEAEIGFRKDAVAPVIFPAVWSPVAKPPSVSVMAAATIIVLAVIHTIVLTIRRRRLGAIDQGT